MSESTVTKSKVFREDLQLATGGTGAVETGTRITSTGGEATLTKLDAAHIQFRTLAKSLDDLVDGGNDVTLKPNSITMAGTLTLSAQTTAGFVKNSAAGVISGGNSIVANDIPSGISATVIADGSVSNTEFQYLNGVTSAIQTQLNALATAASQADQETGTEAAKYVAPATQHFHPSAAKAWVKFTGNSTTILADYNVASITDGVAESTVNLDTAFSSTHYVVCAFGEVLDGYPSMGSVKAGSQAVGAFILDEWQDDQGNVIEPTSVYVVCFGDQ